MRPHQRQVRHNKLHIKQSKRLLGKTEYHRHLIQQCQQTINPDLNQH